MFTDKLQNPFLKPSPFTNSTAHYTPSYSSSNNFPPRFGSYNPYQEPKSSISSASNQYSRYDHNYNAHGSRTFQSRDIDTILTNNPFNKEYKPSFGYSKASRDYSPSQVNNYNYDLPTSNYNYQTYSSANKKYEVPSRPSTVQNRYSENTARVTPTKKYDNYLSTSSADSATTYINKIYQLDDDKSSVNEVSKPLSNPFFRKNLLQKTETQTQLPTRDYDSAALKYMGYKMEEKRQRSPYHHEPDPYQDSYKPQKSESHLNRGLTFGGSYGQPSKDSYINKYEDYDKYGKNFDSKPSLDREINYEDIYRDPLYSKEPKISSPQKDEYSKPKYGQDRQSYPSEVDNYEPRFGSNYDLNNYTSNYSKQHQSTKNIQRKEDNYMRYDKQPYESNHYEIEKQPYQYNLDKEYERPSKKDIYESRKSDKFREDDNRVRFDSESETDSKYQNNKGYEGKFQTLGGNPYSSKPQESFQPEYKGKTYDQGNSFGERQREPPKFSSSQVDEYNNPQDIEKKIKEVKYRKLGYEPQYERPKKSEQIGAYEQDEENVPVGSKVPTRDNKDYPKVLEVNGVLFHKVQVM